MILVLDSHHDSRSAYYFMTNSLGTQTDGRLWMMVERWTKPWMHLDNPHQNIVSLAGALKWLFFTRDMFLKVFYQTNSIIDRKNILAVFVYCYKPPFGTVEFGQRSKQGNPLFLKFTSVL